jgi:hypothetical protein
VTSYIELNDFVNQTFFDGKNGYVPVYLSLEDDDREKLAELIGVGAGDLDIEFGAIVRGTLDFSQSNIYVGHVKEFKLWQGRNFLRVTPGTVPCCGTHAKRGSVFGK